MDYHRDSGFSPRQPAELRPTAETASRKPPSDPAEARIRARRVAAAAAVRNARIRGMRMKVAGAAVLVMVVMLAVITTQLVSGNDPALARSAAKLRATRAKTNTVVRLDNARALRRQTIQVNAQTRALRLQVATARATAASLRSQLAATG